MFDEESLLYTTVQGDTWDTIAYFVFGDEKYASAIMEENYDLLDVLVFDSSEIVQIPEIDIEEVQDLPSWLDDDYDDSEDDPFAEYEDDENDYESGDDWIDDTDEEEEEEETESE